MISVVAPVTNVGNRSGVPSSAGSYSSGFPSPPMGNVGKGTSLFWITPLQGSVSLTSLLVCRLLAPHVRTRPAHDHPQKSPAHQPTPPAWPLRLNYSESCKDRWTVTRGSTYHPHRRVHPSKSRTAIRKSGLRQSLCSHQCITRWREEGV
jgi:hypothetical protein